MFPTVYASKKWDHFNGILRQIYIFSANILWIECHQIILTVCSLQVHIWQKISKLLFSAAFTNSWANSFKSFSYFLQSMNLLTNSSLSFSILQHILYKWDHSFSCFQTEKNDRPHWHCGPPPAYLHTPDLHSIDYYTSPQIQLPALNLTIFSLLDLNSS